jgi:hypothetical protein
MWGCVVMLESRLESNRKFRARVLREGQLLGEGGKIAQHDHREK